MKNVIVRSISGVVYIAIIVAALLLQGPWIAGLCVVLGALAAYEYVNICSHTAEGRTSKAIKIIDILFISVPVLLYSLILIGDASQIDADKQSFIRQVIYSLVVLSPFPILGRMIISVFDKNNSAISTTATSILGALYIAFPLLCVVLLDLIDPILTLAMFVLIWLNDTGAFCVGCTMGKHKLCERLSPKKTIEGFVGGLLVCVIAAVIYALIDGRGIVADIILAVAVSVAATLGDLFESMLKRHAGVKDAGTIIPGHGGVLDRIDSLLFVAPVALMVLYFILIILPENAIM